MNWKEIMGIIVTVTPLLPVVIILSFRLERFKCFLALGIFYFLSFACNLMSENYIPVSESFRKIFGIACDLLELPLIFIFIAYFGASAKAKKRIRYFILFFMAFEAAVVLIYGYNKEAITIIMAPGLALVLVTCIWFSLRQIKITITLGKATGKALMISALLFAYCCYTIIYIMYYLAKTNQVDDVFLMYFIAATLSTILLSAGMIIENKRIKKLEELKITRKELSMIYDESQTKITFSADIDSLEKELWD